MPPVVGYILIVLGLIAIAAGIAGGIAKMVLSFKKESLRAAVVIDDLLPTEWLKAFTEFVTKAPEWVVLIVIGMALLVYGGMLIG